MEKIKLLVADDEPKICQFLDEHLSGKYKIFIATEGLEALDILQKESIDIILLDIKMPGMNGISLLRKIFHQKMHTVVIMISGHGTIKDAVESIKLGAFEYIEKPFKIETILDSIERAIKNKKDREISPDQTILDRMIGISTFVSELKEKIKWVAPSEGRVLITGEKWNRKRCCSKCNTLS